MRNALSDYYKLLGVERGADSDTIKAAYRKLALKFHPDHNDDSRSAAEKFKQIADAYRVLSDEDARRFYDRFGVDREALTAAARSPFGGVEELVDNVLDEVLRRPKQKPIDGRDRRYELRVSFAEACLGAQRDIEVAGEGRCDACAGTGARAPGAVETCHVCGGAREVRGGSILPFRRVCSFCGGRGEVVSDPCRSCDGSGRAVVRRTLAIRVPPGSEDGRRLLYRGAGEPGAHGGKDGDLYVVLRVDDDPLFERRGYDVVVRVPITVKEALCGAALYVPTLDGLVRMRVPAGTPTGKRFRLRRRGVRRPDGRRRGDALVQVDVELPATPSPAIVAALDAWPEPDAPAHPARRRFDRALVERYGERALERA